MQPEKLRNLAIIPARGGSKRFPGKNIAKLKGKPLICYSIESAIRSKCFDRIIFSSDDDEILSVAKNYAEIFPEKRPARFAGDTVKVLELVCHMVERPDLQNQFDTISLLLPTCPFRKASDIRQGFALMDKNVDSVISLTAYEFPIKMSIEVNDQTGFLQYVFNPSPLVTGDTRSQDHKPIYRPNGAFYISWWEKFKANRNYFKGNVKGHQMSRLYSVDIDDAVDLLFAEVLLDRNMVELDF
jgi:CMP-N-acetylneuraminic acid synthetase